MSVWFVTAEGFLSEENANKVNIGLNCKLIVSQTAFHHEHQASNTFLRGIASPDGLKAGIKL